MQKAKFPHMEWAKAHTAKPLPIELGFSGAPHPAGNSYREYGSGDPALEAKIARKYGVPKGHVYLVGGTSLANFVTFAALVERGAVVGVETPRYAPLAEIPKGLGANVQDIRRRADGTLGAIPKTASLVAVTSPHNPTGRLLHEADWKKLVRFADRGGVVIVDEVYRDLQTRPPAVAAARHERFLTTGGLSKSYGLGALRVGWVLGAPALLQKIAHADNLISVQCATPSIDLLKKLWSRLPEFRRNAMRPVRSNLATLRRSGIPFIEPQAGLTAFVKVGDADRCAAAMAKLGVGIAPGSFFGDSRYARVFLGADPRPFREGIAFLRDYLRGYLIGPKRSRDADSS